MVLVAGGPALGRRARRGRGRPVVLPRRGHRPAAQHLRTRAGAAAATVRRPRRPRRAGARPPHRVLRQRPRRARRGGRRRAVHGQPRRGSRRDRRRGGRGLRAGLPGCALPDRRRRRLRARRRHRAAARPARPGPAHRADHEAGPRPGGLPGRRAARALRPAAARLLAAPLAQRRGQGPGSVRPLGPVAVKAASGRSRPAASRHRACGKSKSRCGSRVRLSAASRPAFCP
ncbi:hypothetical protein SCOCK_160217 [Actinacidiphila cocklensis]|uniref:Uncharacterized protein n=1 Tax=Actinacidiphila cocklensis TaxID=887465 RepID=A0A9W4E372_9ACTN|nr:hypothetical protein SCOCK_160217 [Actinacidiphila cocklensis]